MARSSADDGGRLRVLIALEGAVGGALRHVDQILTHADPAEFDLHLAVSARRRPEAREDFARWRAAGWTVHEVPMERSVRPLRDLAAYRALRRILRGGRFDLVHTHCAKTGFLGRLAARREGVPAIHTPHVFPFTHEGGPLRRAVYRRLERLAGRWTTRMLLLTDYQVRVALEAGLCPRERLTVIPNGVEVERFDPARYGGRTGARKKLGLPPEATLALFVGRLCRQKAPDVLLEAAERLRDRAPGLRIVLLGDGPLGDWTRSEVARRGLGDLMDLRGQVEDVAPWYAACDFVLLPSRAEGMPYVLLESMAAGRPVVTARVSGMEELVTDGEGGLLVPPEDAPALAQAALALAADPALREAMGLAAREGLRPEWHAQAAARRVLDVYRRVVAGG